MHNSRLTDLTFVFDEHNGQTSARRRPDGGGELQIMGGPGLCIDQ